MRSRRSRIIPALLLCAEWLAARDARGQGSVWVVDEAGGAAFTEIQPAIDAAADGDVVLVRAGHYASFAIDGRSLAVIGQDGADVEVLLGTVAVRNVGAAQSVLLRGFDRIATGFFFDAPTFSDCAGPVLVEDCRFEVNNFGASGLAPHAIVVDACAAITFVRCQTHASQSTPVSGSGLAVSASRVALYDCDIAGRVGTTGFPPHDGGNGAQQAGGFLFASGSQFTGGNGGPGVILTLPTGVQICGDGGSGGDGLAATGAPPEVIVIDTGLAGGAAAIVSSSLGCVSGEPGDPLSLASGQLVELPGEEHWMQMGATACEGGLVTLTLHGGALEPVIVVASSRLGFQYAAELKGVLVPAAPFHLLLLAPLPVSGELTVGLPIPMLPPAAPPAQVICAQPAFRVAPGSVALGAPSALVVFSGACP